PLMFACVDVFSLTENIALPADVLFIIVVVAGVVIIHRPQLLSIWFGGPAAGHVPPALVMFMTNAPVEELKLVTVPCKKFPSQPSSMIRSVWPTPRVGIVPLTFSGAIVKLFEPVVSASVSRL